MFKRILAASDVLTAMDSPVLTAAKIAERNNAKLYILHVMESASTENRHLIKHFRTGEDIITTIDYEKSVKTQLEKIYKDTFQLSLNYEIRVIPGFPWEEILRWSREKSTDLIVMGPIPQELKKKKWSEWLERSGVL